MFKNGDYHKVNTSSRYLKRKYGENIVCCIIGTPQEVWEVEDWREKGNLIVSVIYRDRLIIEESVPTDNNVICVEIAGFSELLHTSEIEEKTTKPDNEIWN